MSSSAQRELYDEMYETQPAAMATGTEGAAGLRHIAADRLAAHRRRRASAGRTSERRTAEAASAAPVISEAAQRVRAAVAERYRESLSYREFLEAQPVVFAEPEREAGTHEAGTREAGTHEAEVIAAVVSASADVAETVATETSWDWVDERAPMARMESDGEVPLPSFAVGEWQVRPYEELPHPVQPPERSRVEPVARGEELEGLEEEIEFRLAPEFDEHLIEPLPIPGNIIEFPRQLVAPRKARPRLAEGPLRRDAVADPVAAEPEPVPEFQMRIFEVEPVEEPATVETVLPVAEAAVAGPRAPEWQELVLDTPVNAYVAPVAARVEARAEVSAGVALQVARFELRLMSAMVDAVCIAMSFVAFVTVAVWMSGRVGENALRELPVLWLAGVSLAAVSLLAVVYQAVFFTLGATTPGMSYAGLEFRSLTNREPSRRSLRRRAGANVLAAAPLGLGLLWSVFDRQRLGWNDRMSGLFLREF